MGVETYIQLRGTHTVFLDNWQLFIWVWEFLTVSHVLVGQSDMYLDNSSTIS
jgi:hypothetical protein